MISIQTTISRFPDDVTPAKSATPETDERIKTKDEWDNRMAR
jgi:hypothetical protein